MKKREWKVLGLTAAISFALPMLAYGGQWQQDANGWWWQEDDGTYPADGWKWIDDNQDGTAECYYFTSSGYILSGTTTPDNYTVNENGAWVIDGAIQQQAAQETAQTDSSQTSTDAGKDTASLEEWKDNFRAAWKEASYAESRAAVDRLAGQIATPALLYYTFTVPQTDGLTSEIVSDLCNEIHNDYSAGTYRPYGFCGYRWQWKAHDNMITVNVLDVLIGIFPDDETVRSYGFPVD